MNNMDIWNQVKQPPASALKTIQAGRLKGKSDINPQWRYQVMTEQFGMAGLGWGYDIKRLWSEKCDDGQVFAFAEIELWVRGSHKPIPGIGGSMLVNKEQSGLHASDEGYKMAVTDALGVAMKMLGVAADVYAGLWDGSKYNEPKAETKAATKTMVEAAKEAGGVVKDHWCEKHQVQFFKTEKMKSYAHPVKGSKEWCHESEKATPPKTEEAQEEVSVINLGTIRSVLANKGYKSEADQLRAMLIKSWDEINDLEGALTWANDVEASK